MILLIDNYDSFVFNLARYFRELGQEVLVRRNDRISLDGIHSLAPQAIVLSPGPGRPETAGISVECVRRFAGRVPILGVCLGHQAIALAFGGKVLRSNQPVHGEASSILHRGSGIFAGLPSPMTAGRYHSLIVDPETLSEELEVSAWTFAEDPRRGRTIMAISHQRCEVIGVQFHPESILTPLGKEILANFLRRIGAPVGEVHAAELQQFAREDSWWSPPRRSVS
jgi:anthranilate synthase component 2